MLKSIFNVYNEDRRDDVNQKPEAEKPKFIRVSLMCGRLIPDNYVLDQLTLPEERGIYRLIEVEDK